MRSSRVWPWWFGPHDEDGFPAAQASLLDDSQVLFDPNDGAWFADVLARRLVTGEN